MEIAIAIISVIAMFLPNLVDDFQNKYLRDKKNIAPGKIYSMIDEALTKVSIKGQSTMQKFLTKLSTALMALNTAGSQAYADYVNNARKKNLEMQQKLTDKSVEASISEQAANTLANAYESMSSRNKNSESGKTLRQGIKDNINRAVEAYKEADPSIDTTNLQDTLNKYDAVETPAGMSADEIIKHGKDIIYNTYGSPKY